MGVDVSLQVRSGDFFGANGALSSDVVVPVAHEQVSRGERSRAGFTRVRVELEGFDFRFRHVLLDFRFYHFFTQEHHNFSVSLRIHNLFFQRIRFLFYHSGRELLFETFLSFDHVLLDTVSQV